MIQRKRSNLFGLSLALALMGLFTAVLWSAPAPKEDPTPEGTLAAEPVKATEEEAAQHIKNSTNNLHQLAIAFHNYAATFGEVPHDIADEKGKALLSWRVALLPYLEQDKLYKQFKLDEPWDSENNKKLLAEMPEFYASPRVVVKKKGYTVYQGFAGEGSLFEPGTKLRFPAAIADGTSNTILAVESSLAVPWTKPADLPFDVKKDLPDIGKAYGAKPLAALCDGSVRILNLKTITPDTLKAAITIAGGEVLGADW
ncbi:MAG: DUF1559 domain-containing protein [Gemmataceae bacterium]